jgi:hypothetical protein
VNIPLSSAGVSPADHSDRSHRRLLAAVVAGCSLVAAAPPFSGGAALAAEAEDSAEVGKITLLNRTAMEEYQNLNFDEAQRLLKEALELATRSGLSQHPIRARTYLNLGIVTLVGLRQRDAAIRYFRKALQIEPEIKLNRTLVSPDIRAAFDEAVQGLTTQPADLPSEELLLHDPVQTGVRGQPVTVAVFPQAELALATLVLAYRPAGMLGFSEVKMQRKASGAFDGVIPAQATAGEEVAYYIEARRADGKPVASRGSADHPLVIALAGPAPPTESPIGPTGPGPGPGAGKAAPKSQPRFVVALELGTGVGWASGTAEATHADSGAGAFRWTRLGHFAPEIGVWVTPGLLLGLQGRFQLVTGTNDYHIPETPPPMDECGGDGICSAAKGAIAGFLKASWFFLGRDSKAQPYVALAVGGGNVRFPVSPEGVTTCGPMGTDKCADTLAAGPLLLGPSFGLHYPLAEGVKLAVALQGLIGAPTFSFTADLNLGFAFEF